MQATATQAQRRQRFALTLDEDRFRPLIKAYRGELPDYKIGELFGMDDSEWSLTKRGKRYLSTHVLAVLAHDVLPGVPTIAYTNRVEYRPRGAR